MSVILTFEVTMTTVGQRTKADSKVSRQRLFKS